LSGHILLPLMSSPVLWTFILLYQCIWNLTRFLYKRETTVLVCAFYFKRGLWWLWSYASWIYMHMLLKPKTENIKMKYNFNYRVMVFNATFNNISVISWRSILLVEKTEVPWKKYWPVASHWQTLSLISAFEIWPDFFRRGRWLY
jgi:hypothetical protein